MIQELNLYSNKKYILPGLLALTMLTPGIGAMAQQIMVTVDGEIVQFQGIGPQQINGRTMVPVRGVLEKLGADVHFNSATQTVTASTATIDIQLTIGSQRAIVNGRALMLDVPAQTINDHTFVPLRFLGESLGADLRWDADSRTVIIKTGRGQHQRNENGNDPPRRNNPPPVQPPAGPAPQIESFSQRSNKWMHAGDPLEVTLDGTPGGQASFRVPGLVDEVPMRETGSGHYTATWQVPNDKRLRTKAAAVIGSLTIGTRSAPLIQAGQLVSIDTVLPMVRDASPEDKSNLNDTRPSISAAFEDDGSGVDKESVRLTVNGRDVTGRATVTRDFITYRPETPLPAGMQQVELQVADMAGNVSRSRWAFMEQPRAEAGIKSVSDNVDHALLPGDTMRGDMVASPGGRAFFSIGPIQNVAMREQQPGHYAAEYTVKRGDDITDKPIVFHLETADGQRFEQSSRRMVRVTTGKPEPPIVTSPGANEVPGNPLVVAGKARPNARVQVRVIYRNRVLGVFALQGTAADITVIASRTGNWQTEPINMGRTLGSHGVEYTISAIAINAAGETSDATVVKFRTK